MVKDLQQAMIPAATAASDFESAASQITSVFPSIEATADSYEKFNTSLHGAAQSLAESTLSYSQVGSEITGLIEEVKQSLVLQSKCNQNF